MQSSTFGDGKLPGYEFGAKNGPALIVLQEWWGITPTIKEQAVMLSESSWFRTLVPDFYKGKLGADKEEALHIYTNLDWPSAVLELTESVKYLKSSGASKVGVVGFCMGGALAYIAAQHCGVDAAAPFYGIPQEEYLAAGGKAEIFIYEDSGHGFMNSIVPSGPALMQVCSHTLAVDDANVALARIVEFSKLHLKA